MTGVRMHVMVLLAGLALAGLPARAEPPLFRADFETDLRAGGADPPEPSGAAGGGYEVSAAGRERPVGVALDRAFAAEGKQCLRLGDLLQWHVGHQDVINGRLSLWIMPMALPWEGERRTILWGGDAAKPYQTLRVEVDSQGRVWFGYYSWQRDKSWLRAITTAGALAPRRWNHLAVTWGEGGQCIYLNGKREAHCPEVYPLSWLFDLRLGGLPCFVDDLELAPSSGPPTISVPDASWRPTTPAQEQMARIEAGAAALVREALAGSDAHCRGLAISYVARNAWSQALQEPLSELGRDNLNWMEKALAETRPQFRPGEIPVPAFDGRPLSGWLTVASSRADTPRTCSDCTRRRQWTTSSGSAWATL